MNKSFFLYILIGIICFFVVSIVTYFGFKRLKFPKRDDITLVGKISNADFKCNVDGDCTINVDKYLIKLAGGKSDMNEKWGEVKGIDFSQSAQKYVGQMVKIFATQIQGNRLTIAGDKKYFVEILSDN